MKSYLCPLPLLLLAASLTAQDPKAPPGGFNVVRTNDRSLTWSDGYKTKVDVYYPKAVPPKTGWPVVAAIHGKSHDRKSTAGRSTYLARFGYVVLAYDWRGSGDTVKLNASWTGSYDWDRLIMDSAESYGLVAKLNAVPMDLTRLAMTGASAGANHCFEAAAQSGKPFKTPGFLKSYPKILAVAPSIYAPVRLDMQLPGHGLLLQTKHATELTSSPPSATWLLASQARYSAMYALLKSKGWASRLDEIKKNNVPILARMGHDDYRMWPSSTFDALEQLPSSHAYRAFLSTAGHGVGLKNSIEKLLMHEKVRRWFDHFVKGFKNDVMQEPRYEIVVNEFGPDYLKPSTEREHRFSKVWPPKTPSTRYYLRGGVLNAKAPSTAEASTKILHRVKSGYDFNKFINVDKGGQTLKQFQSVTQSIPFVSQPFVGPVLQEETELLGRTMVECSIKCNTGDFQISAALLAQDPKTKSERYIVSGTTAVRGKSAGVHRVRFALRETAMIVPKGFRLVLRLENLSYYRTPQQRLIEYVPWFQSQDLEVLSTPTAPALVEIPIANRGVGLTPRLVEISTAAGFRQDLHVNMGVDEVSRPYLLYIGASGFGPGLPIGTEWLPLNVDAWTLLGMSLMNTTPFTAFAGITDAQGKATATLQLPAAASKFVLGQRINIAGLCFPAKGAWKTAGPAVLLMQ